MFGDVKFEMPVCREMEGVEYKQKIEGEVGRGQNLGVVVFDGIFRRGVTSTEPQCRSRERKLPSGTRWRRAVFLLGRG